MFLHSTRAAATASEATPDSFIVNKTLRNIFNIVTYVFHKDVFMANFKRDVQ